MVFALFIVFACNAVPSNQINPLKNIKQGLMLDQWEDFYFIFTHKIENSFIFNDTTLLFDYDVECVFIEREERISDFGREENFEQFILYNRFTLKNNKGRRHV